MIADMTSEQTRSGSRDSKALGEDFLSLTRFPGGPERIMMMTFVQPPQNNVLPGQEVPDGVLVGQAQAGDQQAFELLVSRYHRPLVNYIRVLLKDDDQAYDVLQSMCTSSSISLCRCR
jgi:hypothetical protein